MDKLRSPSFFEKVLSRTGSRYPILVLFVMQMVSTPLMILLTAMPAQQNANFNKADGISLLIFGGIAMLIRNILLLVQFYSNNRELIRQLSIISHSDQENTNLQLEKRAWEQINTASYKYVSFEFIGTLILVLLPTIVFGYLSLNLRIHQIIQLGLATLAAGLVNLILGKLLLDQFFMPVMHVLLPKQLEAQLTGLKGMRIWVNLSIALVGVAIIGLLLTVPSAYHQLNLILSDDTHSPQLVEDSLLIIVNAAIGAIVVGLFISINLVSHFSSPFRKMIALFKLVETGDLSRRIDVSFPDEFGELNIHLNHMIERLQLLTTQLEQRVIERTAQLNQVNAELNIELIERKRIEEQLSYTALHDPLTDLPNRVLFMDRLRHAMDRAKRKKKFLFAVFFLDLDRFKVVNDSMGHNIGDLLLIKSGERLKSCLRTQDTVARLGGDEFVILLEDMEYVTDYKIVANRILQSLSSPADLGSHKVFISISMGIVLNDPRYEQVEDIIRDADIAMYRAKKLGRNRYEVFDPKMLEGVMTHHELETDLRKALENQEFIVYYQPIMDLEARRIVGFEALVRWQHPTQGLTAPAEFIPTLEEMGLIVPVGYWILDEACRQIRIWQEQFPSDPPLTMSVNLSTRQCTQSDLVEKIDEILKKNNLDASSLNLELTESLLVEDAVFTASILSSLRELGIQVQIDDFGTGYSSLGYLHSLPIDTLKIDRTFISQLGNTGNGLEIVRTILALAHGLGMNVIAEGVETVDQLSILTEMGCESVQGYLFAKPVDPREAGALLGKDFSAFDDLK